jgi:hypothetical protein
MSDGCSLVNRPTTAARDVASYPTKEQETNTGDVWVFTEIFQQ